VRKIGTDRKIPIQTNQAQSGTGDKTAAHSEKSAEDPNKEAYDDQIDRTDVRPGNWKEHGLFGATTKEADQKRGKTFENNSLTNYEQNRKDGIHITVLNFDLKQPPSEKMQHQEKIACDKEPIDRQFKRKGSQCLASFRLHAFQFLRVWFAWRLRPSLATGKLNCAQIISS
jgi:hypothetical protein